ncbi:hypothetical protein KILIM_004_01110 [Kineosphaera limosa NBRC 100340]|uniref:Uncharacterized protein n=2 Tax=Kineosphaera TaxID=211469 RepID=K6X6A9_9MICO|nr:hypothetical protein KILIM_004_01110 [Kineosphaera limosa NBRC 100340]
MTTPGQAQAAWPRAGAAAVALAILVAVLGCFAPPVVIGGLLAPPFAVHASLVVGALVAAVWIGVQTGRPRVPGLIGTGLLCLSLVCLHSSESLMTTTFTILEPAGADGCRVVARESAFLMSGDASVGAIGRHGGPVWMTGHYFVDDGGTPIRNGDYQLKWDKDGSASLLVSQAYDFDPIEPELSCR